MLFAASWKFVNQTEFKTLLTDHGLFASGWIGFAGMAVPALEGAAGLAVLISMVRQREWQGAAWLCTIFLCIAGYALFLHRSPPVVPARCGCGFSTAVVENWAKLALHHASVGTLFGLLSLALRVEGRDKPSRPRDHTGGSSASRHGPESR